MAPKAILRQLSCITFLFLTTIPLSAHASSSSTFTFIKHLEGCKKGENVTNLYKLKSYLQHFGYLNYQNHPNQSTHATNDYFDDELEAALKTYQVNYHLKPTGFLDADTTFKMAMPRCGVPDISNGVNHILASRNRRHGHNEGSRRNPNTVSHYAFFGHDYKWNKKKLSYAIYGAGQKSHGVKTAVWGAYQKWAAASQYFTFTQTADARTSDMKIGFERGDHGDGAPFDGPYNVLAHANAPPGGTLHLDADEKWVIGAKPNSIDVGTVALHEIGHLLGLQHSGVEPAIMYPSVPLGGVKGLHADDIKGIKTLYNVRT